MKTPKRSLEMRETADETEGESDQETKRCAMCCWLFSLFSLVNYARLLTLFSMSSLQPKEKKKPPKTHTQTSVERLQQDLSAEASGLPSHLTRCVLRCTGLCICYSHLHVNILALRRPSTREVILWHLLLVRSPWRLHRFCPTNQLC